MVLTALLNPGNYEFLNPWSVNNLMGFLFLAFFGIFILYKTRKMDAVFLALFSLSAAWWQGVFFLAYNASESIAESLIRIGFIGVIFLPVFAFTMIYYTLGLGRKALYRFVLLSAYAATALMLAAHISGLVLESATERFWGYYTTAGPLFFPFLIAYSIIVIVAIGILFYRGVLFPEHPDKRRAMFVIFLGLIVFSAGAVDFMSNVVHDLYPIGFFTSSLFVVLTGFAVVRHEFLGIETLIHRNLAWLLSSVSVVLLIIGMILLLFEWIENIHVVLRGAIALVMIYAAERFRRKMQSKLDVLLFKKKYKYREEVYKLSDRLVGATSIRKVIREISECLNTNLYPKSVVFLFKSGEGFAPWGAKEKGAEILVSKRIRKILSKGRVLRKIDAAVYRKKDGLKIFDELGAEVLVPVYTGKGLSCIIALGKRRNLKEYSEQDIVFLSELGKEVGPKIESVLRYEDLISKERRLREVVEEEVKKKTKELHESKMAILNMMEDVEAANRELRKAKEELEKNYRKLKEIDAKKDQFISIAAHELKTPLTAIKGFSQFLRKNKSIDKTGKRYLEIMEEETKRLANMVSEILELSRIDLGTIKFMFEDVNLNDVLDSVKKEMSVLAKQKGLKLSFEIDKSVGTIRTDREKLTEILMNIVENAIKYTPRGSVTVIVRQDRNWVHFIVKDTGIGIPEDKLDMIFDRFYQVDSSYTRTTKGTGLGLSLCKEMVEKMGGAIWVKSVLGKGSEFHFRLPVNAEKKTALFSSGN